MSEQLYYIQNVDRGFVGNCPLWWRQGDHGYTCDLSEAGKYDEKQMQHRTHGNTDRAFTVEYIDKISRPMVDMQMMDAAEAVGT